MAFLNLKNIKISGIAAAVPKIFEDNLKDIRNFSTDYDNEAFVELTGVRKRHIDRSLTTSDLCFRASETLIQKLNWEKNEIDIIIVVSQSHDFFLPATACILQDKLGLSKNCIAEDIQLGCSGWVYGIGNVASLMQTGELKKALLMCGDARGHFINPRGTDPLFGYAGTVTALEFIEGDNGIKCDFGTDGSGYEAIITPHGGARYPISLESFKEEEIDGKIYTKLSSRMKGMDVFAFGISTAPKSVKKLAEHYDYDYLKSDFYIFHQANKKMNEMIVKKLKLDPNKVPSSLYDFGNTNGASIPVTIVTQIAEKLRSGKYNLTCCGFGVGLSWGTLNFDTVNLVIPDLVEVESNDNII